MEKKDARLELREKKNIWMGFNQCIKISSIIIDNSIIFRSYPKKIEKVTNKC